MLFQNELLGGLLIGLALAIPMLFEGRIAGASGYAARSLRPATNEGRIGLLFVVGLILGGVMWRTLGGKIPETSTIKLGPVFWIVAGLLVGFGSRLGGGCTSGHGVCGLGRASTRSALAVVMFMTAAIATTFLMRVFA